MKFKKDYINYLLYKTIYGSNGNFKNNIQLQNIANKIIAVEDEVKMTFLVGKTAGLEPLFKYLLYISDKIDKTQISIFNLKDNFEYDLKNLTKICKNISESAIHKPETKQVLKDTDITDTTEPIVTKAGIEETVSKTPDEDITEETEETPSGEGMTLIENYDSLKSEGGVFSLDSINESVENSEEDESESSGEEVLEIVDEGKKEELIVSEESEEVFELESLNEAVEDSPVNIVEPEVIPETEIEIEVKKPVISESYSSKEDPVKEESVTNEAYNNFETKFFEEVKILEKLLATVDRECRNRIDEKLTEKLLQSLTEIIEITSELSNLSRQLMFDLIADVFLTMNIYFTKAISSPELLESEKTKLFDSSLALVNSLIKGEDYLNYDTIVDKIEKLKKQLTGTKAEKFKEEEKELKIPPAEAETEKTKHTPYKHSVEYEQEQVILKPADPNIDSAVFKLKYLVKEFEKSFISTSGIKGEYGRFEAMDKINELNNSLRMIAKISSGVKLNDVLKLAEVTYVFLKYLKDYRIDLLDAEIQQIVKYIIFTFKMLLRNRKPDDFSVLVQHLNNPVKIFTDS